MRIFNDDDLALRLKAVTQIIETSTTLSPEGWRTLANDLTVAASMCRVRAEKATVGTRIETRSNGHQES